MHSCRDHYFPFLEPWQLQPTGSGGGLLSPKTKQGSEKTLVRWVGTHQGRTEESNREGSELGGGSTGGVGWAVWQDGAEFRHETAALVD